MTHRGDPGVPGEPSHEGHLRQALSAAEHAVAGVEERVEHTVGHTVAGVGHVVEHGVPAWKRRTEGEHRWPASVAVVVAIALQVSLPRRYAVPPVWLLPSLGGALLIGLLAANPARIDRRTTGLRAASVALIAVITLANAGSAARLVTALVEGHSAVSATRLLLSGGAIWLTNAVVFALWYWELDRGGPAARAHGVHQYPDFLFPQMATPELAPPEWEPHFVDYFYVSFTNASAFSPTDTLPLVRWAKMTMLLQSAVSLSTVALVIARAVNILK